VASTKSRNPIAKEDVPRIFGDICIDTLAGIGRLPWHANRKRFTEGVREAARIYARDARIPTRNELSAEIAALYRAAGRKRYGEVATLLEQLSRRASKSINRRGVKLPASEDLRDATEQQKACEAVLSLCQYGGRYSEGRRRPSGKLSRTWSPLLVETVVVASKPRKSSPRREAERDFVMWLQVAWLEATGKRPSLAANPKRPGPFARMAAECLRLVGAGHADAVGLINELNRRRIIQRTCHS
jgi:hypothetical protein